MIHAIQHFGIEGFCFDLDESKLSAAFLSNVDAREERPVFRGSIEKGAVLRLQCRGRNRHGVLAISETDLPSVRKHQFGYRLDHVAAVGQEL